MKHKYRILCIFSTFGRDFKLTAPTLIGEDVIVTLDSESGKPLHSFGKDMFLMPHGLTIDNEGNHYVTDVGLHQVLRVTICQMSVDSLFMPAPYFFFQFPPNATKPDLVLGHRMEPGKDQTHFCMPTSVAVAANGHFFVADGYCNSRVMKFNKDGKLIKIISNATYLVHFSLLLY